MKIRRIVMFGRQAACRTCPNPCPEYVTGKLDHADPEAACPATPPRWRALYTIARPLLIGLGDAVAAVAQPIARAIDAVAGTDLAHCRGCTSRKARLNAAVADITAPLNPPRLPRSGRTRPA